MCENTSKEMIHLRCHLLHSFSSLESLLRQAQRLSLVEISRLAREIPNDVLRLEHESRMSYMRSELPKMYNQFLETYVRALDDNKISRLRMSSLAQTNRVNFLDHPPDLFVYRPVMAQQRLYSNTCWHNKAKLFLYKIRLAMYAVDIRRHTAKKKLEEYKLTESPQVVNGVRGPEENWDPKTCRCFAMKYHNKMNTLFDFYPLHAIVEQRIMWTVKLSTAILFTKPNQPMISARLAKLGRYYFERATQMDPQWKSAYSDQLLTTLYQSMMPRIPWLAHLSNYCEKTPRVLVEVSRNHFGFFPTLNQAFEIHMAFFYEYTNILKMSMARHHLLLAASASLYTYSCSQEEKAVSSLIGGCAHYMYILLEPRTYVSRNRLKEVLFLSREARILHQRKLKDYRMCSEKLLNQVSRIRGMHLLPKGRVTKFKTLARTWPLLKEALEKEHVGLPWIAELGIFIIQFLEKLRGPECKPEKPRKIGNRKVFTLYFRQNYRFARKYQRSYFHHDFSKWMRDLEDLS